MDRHANPRPRARLVAVIFDHDGDDMTVKEAFIKLRNEEDARRKAKEEEEKEGKEADGDAESADKKEGEG